MTTATAAAPIRPYPGIASYQYLDHAVFFGRDQDSERLLRLVTIYRGVLLYGGQGLGKSSLLSAGFVPKAVAEGYVPQRIRVWPQPGHEIVAERMSEREEGKPPFVDSLIEFTDGQGRRVLCCDELRGAVTNWEGRGYPLLIFDQFEEFITLFEEAPKGEERQQAAEAQRALTELIVGLARDHRIRVKLLFAFREDYLAKLHKLFVQMPDVMDVTLRLTPLRTDALDELVRGPFRRFPGHFPKEIPERLAAKVEGAISERSATGELTLSEVQIACAQLLESPDPEREFDRKGVQGLLEKFLQSSLRKAGPLEAAAVALLNRMLTDEGLRNVVSEQTLLASTQKEEGFSAAKLEAALKVLADTQLVRRERRGDVVFYSIISEWIVPWIRAQKHRSRLTSQKWKWLRLAAVLALLALASLGTAWWVYQYRTERALGDIHVQLAQEQAARFAELAAQESRQLADRAREEKERSEAKMVASERAYQQKLRDQETKHRAEMVEKDREISRLRREWIERDTRVKSGDQKVRELYLGAGDRTKQIGALSRQVATLVTTLPLCATPQRPVVNLAENNYWQFQVSGRRYVLVAAGTQAERTAYHLFPFAGGASSDDVALETGRPASVHLDTGRVLRIEGVRERGRVFSACAQ